MYQLINEKSIYQYFGDDDLDMIKVMIQIIIDTNIQDLKELTSFYEDGDFPTIKKKVHKAKPTMSYIGADSSRKLLEDIEANLENSQKLNEELQINLITIEEELQAFLKTIQ